MSRAWRLSCHRMQPPAMYEATAWSRDAVPFLFALQEATGIGRSPLTLPMIARCSRASATWPSNSRATRQGAHILSSSCNPVTTRGKRHVLPPKNSKIQNFHVDCVSFISPLGEIFLWLFVFVCNLNAMESSESTRQVDVFGDGVDIDMSVMESQLASTRLKNTETEATKSMTIDSFPLRTPTAFPNHICLPKRRKCLGANSSDKSEAP